MLDIETNDYEKIKPSQYSDLIKMHIKLCSLVEQVDDLWMNESYSKIADTLGQSFDMWIALKSLNVLKEEVRNLIVECEKEIIK